MASSDGQHPQGAGQDGIEFSAAHHHQPEQDGIEYSAAHHQQQQQQQFDQRYRSSTSAADPATDEKNASVPVEQYGVDPEKQSERVGSLAARSDSDAGNLKGLARQMWDRHWKVAAQLIAFIVFTVSVTPSRHLMGVSCLWDARLTAAAAAGGGFTASSASATRTAKDG